MSTSEIEELAWMNGLVTSPVFLRRADGRVERVCAHGVGHTVSINHVRFFSRDGGYAAQDQRERDAWWSHGCDGCCKPEWRQHE